MEGQPRRPCRVQLADGDAHAVCAQVAKAEYPPAGGGANHPNVFLRPVAQDFLHMPLVFEREIHASRAPEDMAEFQAGLGDGRVVKDRQEPGGVRHYHLVK